MFINKIINSLLPRSMRAVVQRVSSASVISDGLLTGSINTGMVVLLGIEQGDSHEDVEWLADKIRQLRIFQDQENKMNLSIDEAGGDILLVSQFTLHASTKKGNRPSFIKAARPEQAIPLYEYFKKFIATQSGKIIQTGVFGADMKLALVNDGPVTIFIDSKNKE
jgi:D-aminoacyl-tRNA deacylase